MDEIIRAVVQRVNLPHLVEEAGGRLKRVGKTWRTACPLHGGDNKTAFAIYSGRDGRQRWHCFTGCQAGGDAIDFYRHWQGVDFLTALHELAAREGISLDLSPEHRRALEERERFQVALRRLAAHYHEHLWRHPHALAYAHARGWNDETIRHEGLGFADDTVPPDMGHPQVNEIARRVARWAAQHGGALVYVHRDGSRVVYLSLRALQGKAHYNPPADLLGPRRAYANHLAARGHDHVLLVESPACALSLAQWGLPAVALCGTQADDDLVHRLAAAERVTVIPDGDGRTNLEAIADTLGPTFHVAPLLEGVQDINDWHQQGATADDLRALLEDAPTYLEVLVDRAREEGTAEALRAFFTRFARLDPYERAARQEPLRRRLGLGKREFKRLLGETEKPSLATPDRDEEVRTLIGGFVHDHLFEMIVDQQAGHTAFAVRYPDGHFDVVPELHIQDVLYRPLPPDDPMVEKRVVLFPSALAASAEVDQLDQEIRAFIRRYVHLPEPFDQVGAVYVRLTWLYDSFQVLPYLRALGNPGMGKTRFLEVLGHICFRPMFLAGASSSAAIFRIIDRFRGTLILDEADFYNPDVHADIVKILNSGYRRHFPVLRAEPNGNGKYEVIPYEVFGPKLIANRRRYQDLALESRMLTLEMTGLTDDRVPLTLPPTFFTEARSLRNRLLRYRLEHWQPISPVDAHEREGLLDPRMNQMLLPLLALASSPREREILLAFARTYQHQVRADMAAQEPALILQALLNVYRRLGLKPLAAQEQGLRLAEVAKEASRLFGQEAGGPDAPSPYTPKKVGHILRHELYLRTKKRGGVTWVLWDAARVRNACRYFGIPFDEKGEG